MELSRSCQNSKTEKPLEFLESQAVIPKCSPIQMKQLALTSKHLDYQWPCSDSAPWFKEGREPSVFHGQLVHHEAPFHEPQLHSQHD